MYVFMYDYIAEITKFTIIISDNNIYILEEWTLKLVDLKKIGSAMWTS